MMSQKNLDAAPADMKGSFQGAMAPMKPYIAAGSFKPISGAIELVPGIRSVPAYGHTPGHPIYAIESEGEKLVVWGVESFVPRAACFFTFLPAPGLVRATFRRSQAPILTTGTAGM